MFGAARPPGLHASELSSLSMALRDCACAGRGDGVVGLVFVGVALDIFMLWMFQMRQLAGNMNKKIR